ncbi:hypothetical protein [Sphingomonas sp. Leaf38]|uniref:hypothetical protein n=1 Tax=Sphingomonas sp. Leaf38 TaxID=1736217 RepID=UPI000A52A4F6|nr:hypothetical protein [Sphingomonas sp. Leaf38]
MPGESIFMPIAALNQAAKTVPAVKYAVALVGIAGAITLIRRFVPDVGVVAMLPVLGGAIVAMPILVILTSAVASPARTPVAKAFLGAVRIFVITFTFFTVTAVAFNWPPAWAAVILPSRAANVSLADVAKGDTTDQATDGNRTAVANEGQAPAIGTAASPSPSTPTLSPIPLQTPMTSRTARSPKKAVDGSNGTTRTERPSNLTRSIATTALLSYMTRAATPT